MGYVAVQISVKDKETDKVMDSANGLRLVFSEQDELL